MSEAVHKEEAVPLPLLFHVYMVLTPDLVTYLIGFTPLPRNPLHFLHKNASPTHKKTMQTTVVALCKSR